MAQEKGIGESWEEIVKAYAKAERELGIKVYCVLCICKKVNGKKLYYTVTTYPAKSYSGDGGL